jgi:hypothetical protein
MEIGRRDDGRPLKRRYNRVMHSGRSKVAKTKTMSYTILLTLALPFLSLAAERNVWALPFSIGPEYTVTRTSRDSIPSPIPGAEPTTQITVEIAKEAKRALIFCWNGPSHRDLGPMTKKASWPVKFLGNDATLTKTGMFMGQRQEVLVLHSSLDGDKSVMIYSKHMTKEEFTDMLGKMSRK